MSLVSLIGCSSGSDGPSGPGGGHVTLDASHASSDSVGVGGGSITATSGAGVRYTLQIPAGALQTRVKITLTPISAIKTLPVSGGFAAGADFQPRGLHFAHPVRLVVTPVAAAPSGTQLVGLTFEGDLDTVGVSPVVDSAGTKILFVNHFSAASLVFGTTADVQALASAAGVGSANQLFISQLAALGPIPAAGNPAALPILQQWFASIILPELQGATTDAELIIAVGDYDLWATDAVTTLTGELPAAQLSGPPQQPLVPATLATEVNQAAVAAGPALRAAIAGNNGTCLTQRNLQAMLNEFFWLDYASYFRISTSAEQLDRATVIANLCGEVRLDSSRLADPIPAGQSESFDMVWGFLIGHSPPVIPSDFQVSVTATGATVSPASGLTGPNPQGGAVHQGFFTTVVSGNSGATATLTASACLIPPGETTPIPGLCHAEILTREVTGTCSRVVAGNFDLNAETLGAFGDVKEVDGSLQLSEFSSLTLSCVSVVNELAVTAPWQLPGNLKMPALTSLGDLVIGATGLRTVELPSGINLRGLLLSGDLTSITPLGDVTDDSPDGGVGASIGGDALTSIRIGHINLASTTSAASIGGLSLANISINGIGAGNLILFNLPAVSTVAIGTVHAHQIEVFGNVSPKLLDGIASNSTTDGFFFVTSSLLSESEALAFANRITVTSAVCQFDGATCSKHYQGPPWH